MADPSQQLAGMLQIIRGSAADKLAVSAVLQQISAGLADVVSLLEDGRSGDRPEDPAAERAKCEIEAEIEARAMAAALGPVLAMLKIPEPRVQIDVQPAAVTAPQPRVEVNVQPAPVTVQPAADRAGQQWDIEFRRPPNNPSGPLVGLRITRL